MRKPFAIRWLFVLVLTIVAIAPLEARSRRLDPFLGRVYDDWLASVWFLASDAERAAFAALDDDQVRERFIRRFWRERGAQPPVDSSSPLARWRENSREVERRFDGYDEAQARALMIAGKPPRVARVECDDVARRIEIWSYDAWHARYQRGHTRPSDEAPEPFLLLFFLTNRLDYGSYAHWSPAEGTRPLTLGGPGRAELDVETFEDRLRSARCLRRGTTTELLSRALRSALGPEQLRAHLAPTPPDPAWLDDFDAQVAAGVDRPLLPAGPLEIRYPGYYNDQRTIVEGRIPVPTAEMARGPVGQLFDRVVIEGEIHRGTSIVDVFRVVHDIAGAAPADDAVPLSFYRRLRPGTYRLDLRVEDAYGLGLLRTARTLEVPRLEEAAVPPAGSQGFVGLTREIVGRLQTLPSVEVLSPGDDHLVGEVEVAAVTTGGPIDHVTFWLDDQEVAHDDEPPFTARLDLGPDPVRHRVTAVAYDPAERELARDARALNAAPRRFDVRLLAPRRGEPAERAVAEVDVPADEQLERLDFFVDDQRIATVRQPPFEAPLPVPLPPDVTYVRAVATLISGARNEDLAVVGTRVPVDELEVQWVELFTSVTDRQGRNVTGLTADAFTIREDGTPQALVRFDTVSNLPINVALMMDVSASMRRKVDVAAASARRFFETVLTDKDTASLVTFNHDLERVVPFTADIDRLGYGTVGFRPTGTTRLHDGIVLTVHAFGGLDGKRALVVLSDGQDVDSDFAFEQVREYVVRSGVAVYPILLDLESDQTADDLERLAGETGGRFFAVERIDQLDGVYRQIEEDLRAQYLLVYAPPPKTSNDFRRVTVTVDGEGTTARTIHGYYP